MRVRLHVVAYQLEDGWAFTVTDTRHAPIVRSASHDDEIARTWGQMNRELSTLLDVQLTIEGASRYVRLDQRWDVAVRVVGGSDELPFRVS